MESKEYIEHVSDIQVDFKDSSQTTLLPRQAYRLLELLLSEGYEFADDRIGIDDIPTHLDELHVAVINNTYILVTPVAVKQVKREDYRDFIKRWINKP